jgi:hypothetical protein
MALLDILKIITLMRNQDFLMWPNLQVYTSISLNDHLTKAKSGYCRNDLSISRENHCKTMLLEYVSNEINCSYRDPKSCFKPDTRCKPYSLENSNSHQ